MKNKSEQKYGFNVFTQQPEEMFEYIVSEGLQHIEINLSHENLSVESFSNQRIENLLKFSLQQNIQYSFHVPYYINISDILFHLRRTNIKYLLNCIDIAAKLKATHITLHIGSFYWFPVEQWNRKRALLRFIKSINKVLKIAEDKNVPIAIENLAPIPRGSEYYLLGDGIKDFEFIFSKVNSGHLKFCLDTGHANMAEGVIPYIASFKEKLCCIHYHDNNGSNDEHLPVGNGNVPWQEVSDALKDIDYLGPLVSECRGIEAHESAQLLDGYFND